MIPEHGIERSSRLRPASGPSSGRIPRALLSRYDLSTRRCLFLSGERLDPETCSWASEHGGAPVIDHWWQTETGWPIVANLMGLDPKPVKPGSPTVPVPGDELPVLDEDGGHFDQDAHLFVMGRADDVINVAGAASPPAGWRR